MASAEDIAKRGMAEGKRQSAHDLEAARLLKLFVSCS